MAWNELGWAFRGVRELELRGEVSLPADDDYVFAAISSYVDSFEWETEEILPRYQLTASTADRLRAAHDLFDKVFWRIFEVDRDQADSQTGTDQYLNRSASWLQAVLDLIADGTIDRGRVLDATLAALGWATNAFRARWFAGPHRELAPRPDETATRQDAYDLLLRSPIGHVTAVGLDAFLALRAAGTPVDPPNLAAAILSPGKASRRKS